MMQPSPSPPHDGGGGTYGTYKRAPASQQAQSQSQSHTIYINHPQHNQQQQHVPATYTQNFPQQTSKQHSTPHPYPPPGYRLGGNTPYRDDPQFRSELESFNQFSQQQQQHTIHDKSKHLPLSKRVIQSVLKCGCLQCASPLSYNDDLYYQDDFNDFSGSCSIGTSDDDGVWLNRHDPAGTLMAVLVWFLIGYSSVTITFLAQTGGIPTLYSFIYTILAMLALACHAKTSLTDPGAVPASAVPTEVQRQTRSRLSMCSQCQTFKPPQSHHCRICNRCVSRMDHHCPWMNNCIGAGNLKHFVLFLAYTWTCSALCLLLLGWNYFFCASEDCTFTTVLIQLVRVMTVLGVGSFLFTSSMLMNVCYGIMTGIGTIDRLKKKSQNTMDDSDEDPIPLKDVFGIGPYWHWWLPIDPIFEDYDRVMGYTTHQRLLREQLLARPTNNMDNYDMEEGASMVSRDSFGIPM